MKLYETLCPNIGETKIRKGKNENLLGLTIDRNLNFDDHVSLCAKKLAENHQLSALSRISNYMSFEKKKEFF